MTTGELSGPCAVELKVLMDRSRGTQERVRALQAILDQRCVDDPLEDALNRLVADETESDELLAYAGSTLGRLVFMRGEDPNFGARSLSGAAFDEYFHGYSDAKREAGQS